MDELFKSIMTFYNSATCATLRATNTGGMYAVRHKQNQAPPYMVFDRISDVPNRYMGGKMMQARVQLSIYGDNLSDVMAIHRLTTGAFDDATLTYDSDIAVVCLRQTKRGR